MNFKTRKFKQVDTEYDDISVFERKLIGKITKQRRKTIEQVVRTFNKEWEAPYGYSRDGYRYRCGCEHDCCGCIVSKGMDWRYEKLGGFHLVVLSISTRYNF
jgi:hypothetical protein